MQTEVLDTPLPGVAGDMADHWTASNGDIVSRASEEDETGIPPGVMVAEGEGDDGALLLGATSDVLAGVAVRGHWYATPQQLIPVLTGLGYAPGVTFGVGRTGRYRVLIEENVAKGDEVHVRAVAVTDDDEVAGAFRASGAGTDTIDCTAFCKWVKGGEVDEDTGFGVAVVEINMGLAPLAEADS